MRMIAVQVGVVMRRRVWHIVGTVMPNLIVVRRRMWYRVRVVPMLIGIEMGTRMRNGVHVLGQSRST